MVFGKGTANPSYHLYRPNSKLIPNTAEHVSSSQGRRFSPHIRTAVLYRISSGVSAKKALGDAGVKDPGAALRWKNLSEECNLAGKKSGRPRKVQGEDKKSLVKIAKSDPCSSTKVIMQIDG